MSSALWSVMLSAALPVANYTIEPQSRNPGGFTDFTVSEWTVDQNGQFVHSPFLVVETKTAPVVGPSNWGQGNEQLTTYMNGHAQAAVAGETKKARLYGAIPIGTGVRLFTYNRNIEGIKPMFSQLQGYEVSNDAAKVIQRLQYMKAHQ